ncbi:MAG: hypothetical protein K6A37_09265 [Saccharofermentans sp.]|jgi:hypothetical protein|nr:hypothetical protein [Clostridiales bacterium]MCR5049132.1 hypothetical protein [Saccharofermentans sp.]
MAQRRSTSGRKTSSSSSRSSSKKRSSSKSSSSAVSTFADYFHAFSKTRAFVPVMSVLVITVLVLLDLLLAWNDYDRFFKILGFELLIVGIIWVIGLVLSFGESTPSSGK